MNGKTFLGWFLMVLCGLILAAAIVLVALQWSTTAEVTMYGKWMKANTALLMLCSAAGGLVAWFCVRLFFRGLGEVLRQRKAQRQFAKAVQQVNAETRPAPSAAGDAPKTS